MNYFIVSFTPGPAWRQGVDVFGQTLDQHVDYLNGLYATGAVLMGGPLRDGSGGLTILQCASLEDASSLVESDPAVRDGILAAVVDEWRPIAWGFPSGERPPYLHEPLRISRGSGEAVEAPAIVMSTDIASTPERVWQALTDPDITQQYWMDTRIESDWTVGSKAIYRRHGQITDEQEVLRVEPFRVLSYTFHPVFTEEFRREPPSRVVFEIVPARDMVRLTVTHDRFERDSAVYRACRQGWPMILGNLKALLESDAPR